MHDAACDWMWLDERYFALYRCSQCSHPFSVDIGTFNVCMKFYLNICLIDIFSLNSVLLVVAALGALECRLYFCFSILSSFFSWFRIIHTFLLVCSFVFTSLRRHSVVCKALLYCFSQIHFAELLKTIAFAVGWRLFCISYRCSISNSTSATLLNKLWKVYLS